MGGVGVAGLIEIKAISASQQSWSWGLAELGNNFLLVLKDISFDESIYLKCELEKVSVIIRNAVLV